MALTSILNVFIGLTLTFGCVSLMVTGVNEWIATLFSLRSATLLTGLRQLLNNATPGMGMVISDLLHHPAVNPLAPPKADPNAATIPASLPSYIDARNFATGFIDAIQRIDANAQGLSASIATIPDATLRAYVGALFDGAKGDIDAFKVSLANWFDDSMDRVTGIYKRRKQTISFVVALLIAGLLNIDALVIAQASWTDPALTRTVTAPADAASQPGLVADWDARFPIGWTIADVPPPPARTPAQILAKLLGFIIVALSAMLGAPFWFDLLKRFVNLRGTGPVPPARVSGTSPINA
jgi:hypothetical protein